MHKGIWTIKGCNFIFQGLLKTGRHKASATWASHGIWNCRPKNQSFKLQYRLQTSRGWAHMPHPSQCHELSGKVEIRCRNDHFYDWEGMQIWQGVPAEASMRSLEAKEAGALRPNTPTSGPLDLSFPLLVTCLTQIFSWIIFYDISIPTQILTLHKGMSWSSELK